MNGMTKFLIGAGATALMAWGNHSAVGSGQAFVDALSGKTSSIIGDSGVSFDYSANGALSRSVTLSGDVSDEEKARITKELSGIDGIGSITWSADEGADGAEADSDSDETATADSDSNAATDVAPASEEVVTECQGNIDGLLAGKTIEFRLGSAFIAGTSQGLLDEVAEALKPCAGTLVEIGGHTDASGSAEINTSLSQDRADRVRAALIERGVPEGQLAAKGYGPSKLKNTANPRAAENRRIEFGVTSSAAAPEGE
jgi:OOP family OmpA-OmpF porin